MGNYLVSNIKYPASQYEPMAPEANGVYHEDREVTLNAATGSRFENATIESNAPARRQHEKV